MPDLPADGGFWTRAPPPPRASTNSCPRLLQTDKSGCASQTVDVGEFAPNKHMYVDRFDVSAELEEFGTGRLRPSDQDPPLPGPDPASPAAVLGVVLKGSGQTSFSSQVRTVTFKDVPASYKPGIPFQGKVAGPARILRPSVCAELTHSSPPAGEDGGPRQQARLRRARLRVRWRRPERNPDDGRQGDSGVLLRHGALEGHGGAEGGSLRHQHAPTRTHR